MFLLFSSYKHLFCSCLHDKCGNIVRNEPELLNVTIAVCMASGASYFELESLNTRKSLCLKQVSVTYDLRSNDCLHCNTTVARRSGISQPRMKTGV